MNRTASRRVREERGIAMTGAMLMMMVIAVLIVAIVASTMGSLSASRTRSSNVVGLPPADSAINAYQHALLQEYADVTNSYTLDYAELRQLAQPGDTVLTRQQVKQRFGKSLADVQIDPTAVPPAKTGTMRETIDSARNMYGYWQIYKVMSPDLTLSSTAANLVVYVRAWIASGTGGITTDPRILRVEFRPGLFADYQLVTDAPITYMTGARLDGPIHSNGLYDGVTDASSGTSIWAFGSITCSSDVVLSTAQGAIDAPCGKQEPNTGNHIDILSVEDAFERMERSCKPARGIPFAKCFPAKAVSDPPYRVQLSGSTVSVDGASVSGLSSGMGLLFGSDIELSGSASLALTVAAKNLGHNGAANIRLVGNVGSPTGAKDGNPLGIMAQGDIIVGDPANQCGVTSINGALIAETGTVTIDPRWTTDLFQDNPPTCTEQITVRASLASHHMPVFRWEWNDTKYFSGYTQRLYEWDRDLAVNPPPFAPLTRRWEVTQWTDANMDCLTSRSADSTCQ